MHVKTGMHGENLGKEGACMIWLNQTVSIQSSFEALFSVLLLLPLCYKRGIQGDDLRVLVFIIFGQTKSII